MSDYKLCYVRGNFAYFTTQALGEQWGDDWNDAPYEHNAGLPYTPSQHDLKQGKSWSIEQVAFDADLVTPDDGHCNSPYSVEQINAGAVAWLRSCFWRSGPPIVVPAGVSIEQFTALVHQAGGEVYRRVEKQA